MSLTPKNSSECSDLSIFNTKSFSSALKKVSNSRFKNPSTANFLNIKTKMFIGHALKHASAKAFKITLTFPQDKNLKVEESWGLLEGRLFKIEDIIESFPKYAAVVSIEIHRSTKHPNKPKKPTNFKKPGPKNGFISLKARPHIHICLILFNDFICPESNAILNKWFELTNDVKFKEFFFNYSTAFDVKEWFMYAAKELSAALPQNLLKKYCNLPSSCILYSGHTESIKHCLELCSIFSNFNFNLGYKALNLSLNLGLPLIPGLEAPTTEFPLIERTGDDLVRAKRFMKAIFVHYKIHLWPDKVHLCKLIPYSSYTYEPYKLLSEIYAFFLNCYPTKTQELLTKPQALHLFMKEYSNDNENFLPVIPINYQLIELEDGIYDFSNGAHTPHCEWTGSSYISCVSFWLNHSFARLPWPSTPFSIVERIVETKGTLPNPRKPQSIPINARFLIHFGSLFHRKKRNDRSIYLWGLAGSGKSSLIEEILQLVLGPKIGFLSSHVNRFQLSVLENKSHALLREFKEANLAEEEGRLLIEGAPVQAEKKNQTPFYLNADSNSIIHTTAVSNEDFALLSEPLQRKFDEYRLKSVENIKFISRTEENYFQEDLQNESVSFCILTNLFYFREIGFIAPMPPGWLENLKKMYLNWDTYY